MELVMAKTEHANLDIRVFDKSNPNGICAYLRDPLRRLRIKTKQWAAEQE